MRTSTRRVCFVLAARVQSTIARSLELKWPVHLCWNGFLGFGRGRGGPRRADEHRAEAALVIRERTLALGSQWAPPHRDLAGTMTFRSPCHMGLSVVALLLGTLLSSGPSRAQVPDIIPPASTKDLGSSAALPSPVPLKFPITVAPGAPLPALDGAVGLKDFNKLDYEGWLTGVNDRMFWVPDPKGSVRTVVKFVVLDDDYADQYGGQRTELWRNPHDHINGNEAWFAWGYLFGDGTTGEYFKCPSDWNLIMQNHGASGNPPQAVEIRNCSGGGDIQLKVQEQPSSGQTYYQLGRLIRARWHYFVLYVKFDSNGAGAVRMWYSLDKGPDVTKPPTAEAVNVNTLYGADGFAKIGLYRQDTGPADYPWVAYLWGYGRGATASQAITNAQLPPP
jgi:polysaccharide lyase-like protein